MGGEHLARLRFVPNDIRENENAPAFRVFVGRPRIGDTWHTRSSGKEPKEYLRVRLDDPRLPEPINAAQFQSSNGEKAELGAAVAPLRVAPPAADKPRVARTLALPARGSW
jgi:uncharacterized protein (DUF736 family)